MAVTATASRHNRRRRRRAQQDRTDLRIRCRSLGNDGGLSHACVPPRARLVFAVHAARRIDSGSLPPSRSRDPRAATALRGALVGQGRSGIEAMARPATGRGGADLGLSARSRFRGAGPNSRMPRGVQRPAWGPQGPCKEAGLRTQPRDPTGSIPRRELRSRSPGRAPRCAQPAGEDGGRRRDR